MRISDWSSDVCSSDLLALTEPCQLAIKSTGPPLAVVAAISSEQPPAPTAVRRTAGYFAANGMNFDFSARLPIAFRSKRSEEHTSELQSLMRISYAVFCLKKKNTNTIIQQEDNIK